MAIVSAIFVGASLIVELEYSFFRLQEFASRDQVN